MVLLPTPLKAFTDAMADVKLMLRLCSRNLYGWSCDHEAVVEKCAALDAFDNWDAYPASWPRSLRDGRTPQGTVACTPEIKRLAANRFAEIRWDLQQAGAYYPRDSVRAVLAYWLIPEHFPA